MPVERLRRARDLLAERGYDVRDTALTYYSGAGFAPDLSAGGERIMTLGLADLYTGGHLTEVSETVDPERPGHRQG